MTHGSLLERLGLSPNERAVVIHADDIGMCQATVTSHRQLAQRSALSSASTMTVCSWYPAVARACREADSAVDIGVHLTLSSEWPDCRWGPILGATSRFMCEDSGYFAGTTADARAAILRGAGAGFAALEAELNAQIGRAACHGLDVTHVDSHMYVLYHPALFPSYARVALEHRVPACAPPWTAKMVSQLHAEARAAVVVFDGWFLLPLEHFENRWDAVARVVEQLPPGLSYVITHPAEDSVELRALAADWQARVADHRVLADPRWGRALEAAGVKVLGMRAVRDALFPDRSAWAQK